MIKKLIITTLIGTLVYFAIGYIVFDLLLGNYTNEHTTQLAGFKKTEEEFNFGLLIVSCLAYSALISFIFIYLLNLKELFKAFIYAAIIGVLVAIMTDSYWYASSNFYSNSTVVILDIAGAAISVGVLGFSIGFINKKLN